MLILRALAEIVYIDLLFITGFQRVHMAVARTPLAATRGGYRPEDVASAVAAASVFYVRRLHCLQRAAVVTRLSRKLGIPARLIIGFRPRPIESHAWVEVNGTIVSEFVPGIQHYRRLDSL